MCEWRMCDGYNYDNNDNDDDNKEKSIAKKFKAKEKQLYQIPSNREIKKWTRLQFKDVKKIENKSNLSFI